jgi:hypothetical protein
MKKDRLDNIKAFGCLLLLVPLAMMTDRIPWWSFVIVVALFGYIITIRKWKVAAFTTGFLSGLVIWIGANIFFHIIFGGTVFEKLGQVMFIPGFVVILLSGVIGGLLTGLALYTGKSAVKRIGEEI